MESTHTEYSGSAAFQIGVVSCNILKLDYRYDDCMDASNVAIGPAFFTSAAT